MLKNPHDVRTLCFCLACAAVYVLNWKTPRLGLTCASCLQAFQMSVVVHNCAHTPPFASPSANGVFCLVLTLLSGSPASLYVPGHNESHHRHLEKAGDMMRTCRMTFQSDALNLLLFIPTILPDVVKHERAFMREQRRQKTRLFRQYVWETALYHATLLALVLCDWKKAFAVYLVPAAVGKACILSLNMLQHFKCEPESKYNHSRNFTGPLLNYLFLCNGYHTVHHMRPGLHWSRLPREHAKIADKIDPSLVHDNILRYTLAAHFSRSQKGASPPLLKKECASS